MRKNVLTLALFFSLPVFGQSMADLKKTVAFVYGQMQATDQNRKPVTVEGALGTVFFVFYPDKRGGDQYGFVYTVTAKHVLKDANGKYLEEIKLRVNRNDGNSVTFVPLPVTDKKGNFLWFEDKDNPDSDIAITPLHPADRETDYRSVPVELLVTPDALKNEHVVEGDSLLLVGLQPLIAGEHRNYPIVRRGSIALLPDEPIPSLSATKQFGYVAELASWNGNSGSPVYLSLGGVRGGTIIAGESYRLLGIMLGYYHNALPFDVEPIQPTNSVIVG